MYMKQQQRLFIVLLSWSVLLFCSLLSTKFCRNCIFRSNVENFNSSWCVLILTSLACKLLCLLLEIRNFWNIFEMVFFLSHRVLWMAVVDSGEHRIFFSIWVEMSMRQINRIIHFMLQLLSDTLWVIELLLDMHRIRLPIAIDEREKKEEQTAAICIECLVPRWLGCAVH